MHSSSKTPTATINETKMIAAKDHKLMSTPVSVNDGMKRADGNTWKILGISVIVAVLVVAGINLFVPKSKIAWPEVKPAPTPAAPSDEPRTYDVAPPSAPPKGQ
jgi:hypothetical protein